MNTLPERALSIRQPWVWAILNAGKRIENRPRRFHYRGPICLHASLYNPKGSDWDAFAAIHGQRLTAALRRRCIIGSVDLPTGGIVGTAEIVDCIEQSNDPWFFGPFGLVLDNVQPVPFIQVKGVLGLFRWRDRL